MKKALASLALYASWCGNYDILAYAENNDVELTETTQALDSAPASTEENLSDTPNALDVLGIPGLSPSSKTPKAPAKSKPDYKKLVEPIVHASPCSKHDYRDRGVAPTSYSIGLAATFAHSYCRLKKNPNWAMGKKNGPPRRDGLTHYEVTTSGEWQDALVKTYTLITGMGMRESSGDIHAGRDLSANNTSDETAETGAFQFSKDSMPAHPDLKDLYTEYRTYPDLCSPEDWQFEGKPKIAKVNPNAKFTDFTRQCPRFSAEYAATAARTVREHFGTLNRKEAEMPESCHHMYSEIAQAVEKAGCE